MPVNSQIADRGYRELVFNVKTGEFFTPTEGDNFKKLDITVGGESVVVNTASLPLANPTTFTLAPAGSLSTQADFNNYIYSVIPENTSDLTNDSGFITAADIPSAPDLSTYALKSELPTNNNELTNGANYVTASDVTAYGYATQTWVENKNYLTSHQSLAGYATESWVTSQSYLTSHQDLSSYATQTWVENKGYLTSHQSLAGYATETWVQGNNYLTASDLTTINDAITAIESRLDALEAAP